MFVTAALLALPHRSVCHLYYALWISGRLQAVLRLSTPHTCFYTQLHITLSPSSAGESPCIFLGALYSAWCCFPRPRLLSAVFPSFWVIYMLFLPVCAYQRLSTIFSLLLLPRSSMVSSETLHMFLICLGVTFATLCHPFGALWTSGQLYADICLFAPICASDPNFKLFLVLYLTSESATTFYVLFICLGATFPTLCHPFWATWTAGQLYAHISCLCIYVCLLLFLLCYVLPAVSSVTFWPFFICMGVMFPTLCHPFKGLYTYT